METLKRVNALMVMAAVLLFIVSGCARDNSGLTKSSTLAVNLKTVKSSSLKSTGTKGAAAAVFTLNSAKISISDLVIEENSGSDAEQQGDYNNGGSDAEKNTGTETAGETADVVLPGPYILDVVNGTLGIDKVAVYPGTFKKVDFSFNVSNETGFGGNSIVVTGSYLRADGVVVPVILRSDFSQQVQLPLANNGFTVAADSTVTVSIVLDIPSWMNNIDLSSAVVVNNEIIIDKTVNADLLKLFEANLSSSIEVED